MRTILLCVSMSLLVTACAEKEPIQTGQNPVIDALSERLSANRFGQTPITLTASNGKSCQCKLLVSGFVNEGDMEIRLCSIGGYDSDPGCDDLNKRYSYDRTNGPLVVCELEQCASPDNWKLCKVNCKTY